jgi:hypothetical protein
MEGMDKLQQSLLNAKRFMNHGALNAPSKNTPREISPITEAATMEMPPNVNIKENLLSSLPSSDTSSQMSMTPKSNMTKDAILKSKLPNAIKEAMIRNPIPDPTPSGTLSPDFINEVSKKMNSPQYSINEMRATSNSSVTSSHVNTPPLRESITPPTHNDPIPPLHTPSSSSLKDTIKECLKEILKEENIIVEHKNLKENLQLRVGNKIFTGSIKSVRTVK